ncbi:MAG: ATP-binding cassette domain-containing protein, partial [Parasporobacterium sp.]|nr:ATP-binding cassette domain-containing protein [Parasporobacterium sp.]
MSIIQCENLYVSYEGRPVIENLSFQVEEGDYLCIVGDNGSGKSTLMKTLLGLKKPDKGSITFGCGCAVNGEAEK